MDKPVFYFTLSLTNASSVFKCTFGEKKLYENNKTPPHAHDGNKNVSIQTSEIQKTYEQLTEIIQNEK